MIGFESVITATIHATMTYIIAAFHISRSNLV